MQTSWRADEAITQTYARYADMVYRIAYLMLQNSAEAEDILQDVFIRLLRNPTPFHSEEHQKAWLITTAKNAARDLLKSAWRKKTTAITQVPEPIYPDHTSMGSDVAAAVFGLGEKYRIPLYLYYYEGYKTEEIAKMLQIRPATIRSRLHTARKKLRLMLEEEESSDA